MTTIQPYLETVVQALVGLLVTVALVGIAAVQGKVQTWLAARTTAEQQAILHQLGAEAAAFAESAYKAGGGPEKLELALAYVSEKAGTIGLPVTPEGIRAVVEKAVLDFKAAPQKAVKP